MGKLREKYDEQTEKIALLKEKLNEQKHEKF